MSETFAQELGSLSAERRQTNQADKLRQQRELANEKRAAYALACLRENLSAQRVIARLQTWLKSLASESDYTGIRIWSFEKSSYSGSYITSSDSEPKVINWDETKGDPRIGTEDNLKRFDISGLAPGKIDNRKSNEFLGLPYLCNPDFLLSNSAARLVYDACIKMGLSTAIVCEETQSGWGWRRDQYSIIVRWEVLSTAEALNTECQVIAKKLPLAEELANLSSSTQQKIEQQKIEQQQQKQAQLQEKIERELIEAKLLVAGLPEKLKKIASTTVHQGTRVFFFDPQDTFDKTKGDPLRSEALSSTEKFTRDELAGVLNWDEWHRITATRCNPNCLHDNSPAKLVYDGCKSLGLNTAIVTEFIEWGLHIDRKSMTQYSVIVWWGEIK